MIRRISIFGYLFFFTFFLSCKEEIAHPKDYNTNANKVIQQLLIDESCGCILEIPTKSIIEIKKVESRSVDFEKVLIKKLHLRDNKELDSLVSLSDNFILDTIFLKQQNIKVIPRDSLRELGKNPNFCRKGILCIRKPIFNKEYKSAVLDYGYAFMCLSPPFAMYSFENGKWKK